MHKKAVAENVSLKQKSAEKSKATKITHELENIQRFAKFLNFKSSVFAGLASVVSKIASSRIMTLETKITHDPDR